MYEQNILILCHIGVSKYFKNCENMIFVYLESYEIGLSETKTILYK